MPQAYDHDSAWEADRVPDNRQHDARSSEKLLDEIWPFRDHRKGAYDPYSEWFPGMPQQREKPDPLAVDELKRRRRCAEPLQDGVLDIPPGGLYPQTDKQAGCDAAERQAPDKEANRIGKKEKETPEGKLRRQLESGSFSPAEVDQGAIGDCFFMAALSSLANTDQGRKVIQEMIELNPDGSYTVRFKGDKDRPVTVTDDDIKELGLTNGAKWADIVEAAFLKYTSDGLLRDVLKQSGIGLFARVRNTRDAIHLLTGGDVATDQFSITDLGSQQLTFGETSPVNVRRDLVWAMQHQAVVTAGANADFARFLGGNDPGPVPDNHVYAVLSFDPKTDTVVVRNPWGHNSGSPLSEEGKTVDGITNIGEGKLQMSLATFMKRFSDVNISGRNDTLATGEHVARDALSAAGDLIDAAEDVISGNPGRAARNLGGALTDYYYMQNEMVYGATNLLWNGVMEAVSNPLFLVAPGTQLLNADTIHSVADKLDPALDVAANVVETLVTEPARDILDAGTRFGRRAGGFLKKVLG